MIIETVLIVSAVLLLGSILASKIAARFGVPALLLFLAIGMFSGSEGLGQLAFDNPALTQAIGVVALIFILFVGGLDTQWESVRPALREGILLSTIGVLITALSVGFFAHRVFGFPLEAGIMLGAIMASTDAAAVFSILRGQRITLKGRLNQTLELESGSNDPMAVFLTFGMIQLLTMPEAEPIDLIPLFLLQMGIGALLGIGVGRLALSLINRLRLEYEGLYPVLTIVVVLFSYGLTSVLGGNGFLAVYLAGLTMGQKDFIHKTSLIRFHDGIAWLMQIVMFLALGLQVYPSELLAVAPAGLLIALFLIFIARPLSVFIALLSTRTSRRERWFISWVGLRGAAPIILATFPLLAGVETPIPIFDVVFFVVLVSVLLQGTTIPVVARWLGVFEPEPPDDTPSCLQLMDERKVMDQLFEITLPADAQAVGQQIIDLELTPVALVILIGRGDEILIPRGGTILEAQDRLLLTAQPDSRARVIDLLTMPPALSLN